MKIISKFHDYYDSVQSFGADPSLRFVRKQVDYSINSRTQLPQEGLSLEELTFVRDLLGQFPIERNPYNSFWLKDRYCHIETIYIAFCGTIYQYWRDSSHNILFYTLEEYEAFFKRSCEERYRWILNPKKKWTFPTDRNKNFFIENNLPIVSYCHPNLIVNPCLKNFNFMPIKDTYTAYQELSMFLGGIVSQKENQIVEIEDKYRKAAHGFDDKSFKTVAPGKKPRRRGKPK